MLSIRCIRLLSAVSFVVPMSGVTIVYGVSWLVFISMPILLTQKRNQQHYVIGVFGCITSQVL